MERVPGSVSHSVREQGGAGISLRASGTDTSHWACLLRNYGGCRKLPYLCRVAQKQYAILYGDMQFNWSGSPHFRGKQIRTAAAGYSPRLACLSLVYCSQAF